MIRCVRLVERPPNYVSAHRSWVNLTPGPIPATFSVGNFHYCFASSQLHQAGTLKRWSFWGLRWWKAIRRGSIFWLLEKIRHGPSLITTPLLPPPLHPHPSSPPPSSWKIPPFSWRYIDPLPTCSDLHKDHSPISGVFKGSPSTGSFPSTHECDQIPPILVKNMFLDLPSLSSYHLRSFLTLSSKCLRRIEYTYCHISSKDTTPARAVDVLANDQILWALCILHLAWPLSSTCPAVSGHHSLLVLLLPNFLFFLWFLSWKLFLASLKITGLCKTAPMPPPHFVLSAEQQFSHLQR